MKKIYFILFLIITIANVSNAQKHELQIGVPGTFYFDETPLRMHRLSYVPIPTHFAYK